ncbi:GAF domain-containing protein [Fulvivirga sp. 29W222]|uniref:GAF domain-containing protein n=1 Tax=Fulvivirga marina TaxID=2494733 RepID=A0A937KBR0_9BACT|nr:GAF domain-containing protein [Fulvivirga marina]MBL6447256.1 GAF domain-containing protein [Fulvivirga marina]
MNLNLQNLSLRSQSIAIFLGLVILAIINFFVISYLQNRITNAAKEIEAAKELHSLPPQIATNAQLFADGNTRARGNLETTAKRFEEILLALDSEHQEENDTLKVNGGMYANLTKQWLKSKKHIDKLLFEPLTIDTVVQESKEVPLYDSLNTITTETTQKVLNIRNPNLERANNYLQSYSSELSKASRRVLSAKTRAFDSQSNTLTYTSLIFLLVFIGAIISILIWTRKKINVPMKDLHLIASHVSNGDLSKRSSYTLNNEIGKVAKSINKISENLQNATAFVNAIENGKLDVEFKGTEGEDLRNRGLEGALLTMRDQMKRVEEEERERKWSTEGLAKFVDILRSSNDDVHALSDIIISNLVTYTKSNQGGIFIVNDQDEENKILELISLYAFNTKKYDKRSYRAGEGLVGQTYLERQTTYLLEIPHDYIAITSGLGGANPKAILLVPLMVNEDIYGVIELASFNEYKDYQIEFVEKLAESIASTIAGTKNNQQTKTLLEESQALTEQMQAQEEEMRQNMEELSATQEEMSRKEVEMTAQLTAINNSLSSAEYNMDGVLLTANNNYVKLLGYELLDNIQGISFHTISSGDTSDLWRDLHNGISHSGNYTKRKKNGEEVLVNTTYTPVKNNHGEYYKVIELILSVESQESEKTDSAEWEQMKEVEEELRQNLEELEITQEQLNQKLKSSEATLNLLDNVVKIVIFNNEGTVTHINRSAQQVLDIADSDITGQSINQLVDEDLLTEETISKKEITFKAKPDKINVKAEVYHDAALNQNFIIWI